MKSGKEHLIFLISILALIVGIYSCQNKDSKLKYCNESRQVIKAFFGGFGDAKYGYTDILVDSALYVINSGNSANYFKETISKECDSSIEKCIDKLPDSFLEKYNTTEPELVNPDIYLNKHIVEFTSLYKCKLSNHYYIGMTYSCGNDCGSIELFIMTKINNEWAIESMKNIGQI